MRRLLILRTGRLAAAALAAAASAVIGAAPAAAHTSLVDSEPARGAVVSAAPAEATLRFANVVAPAGVNVDLVDASGRHVAVLERRGDDNPSDSVRLSLPPLEDGVYGLVFESVDELGHRITGDVVFGVGAVAAAPASTAALPRGRDVVGHVSAAGRFGWSLALCLIVGGLYVLRWSQRRGGGAADVLRLGGGRWLRRGCALGLAALIARAGAGAAALVRREGGWLGTLTSSLVVRWAIAIAMLAVAAVLARRLVDAARLAWVLVVGAVGTAVVIAASTGHAAREGLPAVVALSAHALAAAAWVGPLLVYALITAAGRWRALSADERGAVPAPYFRDVSRLAATALAAVTVTGIVVATPAVVSGAIGGGYRAALLAKAALVVLVVLPLAAHHHRQSGRSPWPFRRKVTVAGGAPAELGAPLAEVQGVGAGGLRAEVGVLLVVLTCAAALGGLEPTARPPSTAGAQLLAATTPARIEDCAALPLGRADCYGRYFSAVLNEDGPEAAIAEIELVGQTQEEVRVDCHQLTHDVGREAAQIYPTLGEALSFSASACWSGYYHGVVEERLASLDVEDLDEALPTFCGPTAEPRYGFTHYNCVHGLGHGVTLFEGGDLFAGLAHCDVLPDEWERSSCLGGAFMENVMQVLAKHPTAAVRPEEPLYPCTVVASEHQDECYLMQTSLMMQLLEYDYARGFGHCDTLAPDMAAICYRSMGRDISGVALLDIPEVLAGCGLGSGDLRTQCYIGAALNAVYDRRDAAAGAELCAALAAAAATACSAEVEEAGRSL